MHKEHWRYRPLPLEYGMRPTRTSGRMHHHRPDDDEPGRQVSKAGIVAVVIVVLGAGVLVWLLQGGPVQATTPAPTAATPTGTTTAPIVTTPITASTNRSPTAEIRMRIEARQPFKVEYSGAFSEDLDAADEGRLTYTWDFGDGSQGTEVMGTKTYATPGTYTVTLTVRDPGGATGTATKTVDIAKPSISVAGIAAEGFQPGLKGLRLQGKTDNFATVDKQWKDHGEAFAAQRVDLSQRPRPDYYALRFAGQISFPTAGLYTFALTSDDGSRLLLDGKTLIRMDTHQSATTSHGVIEVTQPGLVGFRCDYYQGNGGQELRLQWSGPGFDLQDVPAEAYFHKPDP